MHDYISDVKVPKVSVYASGAKSPRRMNLFTISISDQGLDRLPVNLDLVLDQVREVQPGLDPVLVRHLEAVLPIAKSAAPKSESFERRLVEVTLATPGVEVPELRERKRRPRKEFDQVNFNILCSSSTSHSIFLANKIKFSWQLMNLRTFFNSLYTQN
jgi:hypothetical protein